MSSLVYHMTPNANK